MIERIPVDQTTRDRIQTEIVQNMCVEAGAGTGKTTIMVARVVEIIRSGHATIDNLVIITFTEKAAAELATRVREALERASRKTEDETERERFDIALRSIYRARIETIHAFAASLLRERPVEAELDPNFDVLDMLRADLSFDDQFRDWINEYLSGDSDWDTTPFRTALNRGLGISQFRMVCEIVHEHRYILPLTIPEVPDPDVFAFRDFLRAEADELHALLPDVTDPEDKGVPEIYRVIDLANRCDRAGNNRERLERVILAASETSKTAGNNANWDPSSSNAEQKSIRAGVNEQLKAIQQELRSSALSAVLPLASAFTREYERTRRFAGQAEFEDLLIWARDLLRDRLHVRRDFQERFRCILVDEFQDTDPLQVEIVMYLASDGQDETDWTQLIPTPGKLFVVGDPKQSIYRFRRADISIYEQVKQEILPDNVEIISQNFRSVPEVIDWVNHVFSDLIQPSDRVQPDYIDLHPFLKSNGQEISPVVAVHSPEPVTTADDVREEEARLLAGTILQAVEQGWPVRDQISGELRPAGFRDVAILLPTRTKLTLYEDVFIEAGIPFRHEGGKEYFHRQEIRDLRATLRAVDNPGDQMSTVAALRSGAFACSDQELFEWYQANRDRGFDYREVKTNDDNPNPVATALATLRSLHDNRIHLSLPEIVERVIEETNLVEFALTIPNGGDQSAANLLKMVDQARAFSSASGGGLRAFVRWMITSAETRSDESDASVAEATDDVVRLMTIHAAKGLEFPIVALANMNTASSSGRGPKVVTNYQQRQLEIQIGGERGYATPAFEASAEYEKQHEEAERLRLLYVAATRAADYLVLPVAVQPEKAKGLLGKMVPYLPPLTDDTRGRDVESVHVLDPFQLPPIENVPRQRSEPVTDVQVTKAREDRRQWNTHRTELLEQGNAARRIVTASSQKDWDQAGIGEVDASARDVDRPVERDMSLRIGNALHAAMEQIDLKRHDSMDSIVHGLVESALNDAGILTVNRHERERVHRMIERALGSDLVRRARSASELAREVEFGYGLSDGGLIQGQMDLVFLEDGEVVIGDFKSDRIEPGTASARTEQSYRGQAAIYAYAARQITGLPVKDVIFYFAEVDEHVVLTGAELMELGEELAYRESMELGVDPAVAD